jgi:hypothetical protein
VLGGDERDGKRENIVGARLPGLAIRAGGLRTQQGVISGVSKNGLIENDGDSLGPGA